MGKKGVKNTVYTDEFVAGAIVALEANGFPDRNTLRRTARQLGIHSWTLARWYYGQRRENLPAEMLAETRVEFQVMLEEQMMELAAAIPDKIDTTTNVRDVAISLGVLFDKYQLLTGGSTQNVNVNQRIERVAELLNAGRTRRGDQIASGDQRGD